MTSPLHLSSLHIQNFRCFEDLKIETLGRVNLIVGANNSGKSTLLEAVQVYAAGGSPSVLQDILENRLEFKDPKNKHFPFQTLFYGSSWQDEQSILIEDCSSENKDTITISPVFLNQGQFRLCQTAGAITGSQGWELPPKDKHGLKFFNALVVKKKWGDHQYERIYPIPLGDSEAEALTLKNFVWEKIGYVSTQLAHPNELFPTWREIVLEDAEKDIHRFLQTIDSSIKKISFVERSLDDRNIIVRVKKDTSDKTILLNSMGEGVARVLHMAIKTIEAKDSFLFIDEFENGLHYSVQTAVWRALFDIAERDNIQIFATTHSNDTIKAFFSVADEKKDLGNHDGVAIRLAPSQRTHDKGQIIATVYDEDRLEWALERGVEIR
jgi:AAA15 family ATPase/GTPase